MDLEQSTKDVYFHKSLRPIHKKQVATEGSFLIELCRYADRYYNILTSNFVI